MCVCVCFFKSHTTVQRALRLISCANRSMLGLCSHNGDPMADVATQKYFVIYVYVVSGGGV